MRFKLDRKYQYIFIFAGLFLGYLFSRNIAWQGSKGLHTFMEAVATMLALMVGALALVHYREEKNNTILFLGAGFLGTASLDCYHAAVTSHWFDQLMPSPPDSLIPWSWVASRLFLSIFMLASWWAWRRENRFDEKRRFDEKSVYFGTGLFVVISFLFFIFYPLPRAYYPELFFGRPEEFIPAFFFLLAFIGYLSKGQWKTNTLEHWIVISLIIGFMGQAMFMSTSFKLFDTMFDAAHVLKKISYICVLIGLFYVMFISLGESESFERNKEDSYAREIKNISSSSLKTQLTFFSVTLSIIPLTIFIALGSYRSTQSLRSLIAKGLEDKSVLVARHIDSFISQREIDIRILSRADVLEGENIEKIIHYLTEIEHESPWISGIDIANKEGTIIASSGDQQENGRLVSEIYKETSHLFEFALNSKQGDVYVSEAREFDMGPGLIFIAPITDEENVNVIKVILMEVSLDSIEKIVSEYDNTIIGEKYVYLVDNAGRIVVSDDPNISFLESFPDLEKNPDLLLRFSHQGDVGHVFYRDIKGDDVMAGFADMREFGINQALDWSIIAIAPIDQITLPAKKTRDIFIIFGIIIGVISLIVGYGLSLAIARPIESIFIAAKRNQNGDYSTKLKEEGALEMRALASALNTMTSNINEKISQLSDQKYALDQHSIVATTDANGKITYANDKFCEISKYSRKELIGQDHRIVNSGYHPKEFIQNLWQTIKSGKVWKNEIRNRAKDGAYYWVDTTIIPFLDENGKPYQYTAIRTDITDRKKIEAERQEALEAKSNFISVVSHELRTPLTAIKEGIDIVYDESAGDINEEQKEFLGLSKRNVDRLARLINDVLDFQKLQIGKTQFYMEEQDLNESAEDVYKIMEPLAREKTLDFKITLDKELARITFDKDKILQVMTNLISNAIKYTDKGSVTMSTFRKNDGAHFSVKDTGLGFSKEDGKQLFQNFEQLGGRERKVGGTGLGLAICKEIIDKHNGKILVESEPGKGSVFEFVLPIL